MERACISLVIFYYFLFFYFRIPLSYVRDRKRAIRTVRSRRHGLSKNPVRDTPPHRTATKSDVRTSRIVDGGNRTVFIYGHARRVYAIYSTADDTRRGFPKVMTDLPRVAPRTGPSRDFRSIPPALVYRFIAVRTVFPDPPERPVE